MIKIEHPWLVGQATRPAPAGGSPDPLDELLERANRGKRSIALDITQAPGRRVLRGLASRADVFLTDWPDEVRRREQVDVADLRAWNEQVIYAHGAGVPLDDAPGRFERAETARTSSVDRTAPVGPPAAGAADETMDVPRSLSSVARLLAVGDRTAGALLAGGIAGALYDRERSGRARVVEVSLKACAAFLAH